MKNVCMSMWDKLMLGKRSIIETIIDQLKNISQIEHSRHRSINNFIANLLGGITAYSLKEKKQLLILKTCILSLSNPELRLFIFFFKEKSLILLRCKADTGWNGLF